MSRTQEEAAELLVVWQDGEAWRWRYSGETQLVASTAFVSADEAVQAAHEAYEGVPLVVGLPAAQAGVAFGAASGAGRGRRRLLVLGLLVLAVVVACRAPGWLEAVVARTSARSPRQWVVVEVPRGSA